MPYNGSGSFSIINTFLPNTTILSAAVNQNLSDIASGLSDALTRDGQAGMTAALAMGNNKITGMADPSISSDGATKNYVDTQFTTAWSTGDIKMTIKTVADSGWLLFDDTTMGSATSGATHASSANMALFELLYTNINDTNCPVLTSSGAGTTRGAQGTAAQAWAANCRMTLPLTLGRALAVSGSGSGLTARALGATTGNETVTLSLAQLPTGITSSGTATPNVTIPGNSVGISDALSGNNAGAHVASASGPWVAVVNTNLPVSVTSNNTSGSSHNNMQPSSFFNAMIKL